MTRKRNLAEYEAKDPAALAETLGLEIPTSLLTLALTHRSWAFENGGGENNERLEFLGDAVLGLASAELLYERHPDLPEGQLARRRAAVVNMHALASIAREIGLGPYIRLGKGAFLEGGRKKESILADTTEAIIGAVYLGLGRDAARDFVRSLIAPLLADDRALTAAFDNKTRLQEISAASGRELRYEVESDGPDHARVFTSKVFLGGELCGTGTGGSKKAAQQAAAADAVTSLLQEAGADA
ncbi:ribonuclease III [Dermabacteraceae bacterium CCM 9519]